mmetsp:Transcript_46298/g.93458  ORF Transcript_46298/g.93458 Transcript_46298/m.93458 type:complete len:193 (+) Transcript_46298:19-597(+)
MQAEYFSVDTLSLDDERVPCVTELEFAGLGHFAPGAHTEDLENETKVELPLWLATVLQAKKAVSVDFPKQYKERFRDRLESGPAAVNLREQSPYYFAVGELLAHLKRDDELQKKLLFAFTGDRFQRIMDLAFNSQNEDVTEHTRSFTEGEQKLFDAGYHASASFSRWKARKHSHLRASTAATNSQAKRQRHV